MTPALAIFAGGLSTRMGAGVDKALIMRDGTTVTEYLAKCGSALGMEVLVIGRAQPHDWHGPSATFVDDDTPGQGPLGALCTALSRRPLILCVACDMPRLDRAALAWLLDCARQPFGDALVVTTSAGLEPLFSIYRSSCLDVIRNELTSGRRAMHRLIPCIDARLVQAPEWLLPHLANCNTPEDWQQHQATT